MRLKQEVAKLWAVNFRKLPHRGHDLPCCRALGGHFSRLSGSPRRYWG
jgi:hypothetical protein